MHIHFIEEGLDWFMPYAHHCCASTEKKVVTQTCVTLPSLLPWLSQKGSAQGWEGGPGKPQGYVPFPDILVSSSSCP